MNILSILYCIIITPITQIIEIAYRVFDKMFGNTGLSVIGVSLTVTLLCLPLYIVAEQWEETERNVQNRMKSGIARIKNFFKGDEQYMILNTFYRQNGYHPIMALRSSFGILIQIPFFLAAYHTLSELPDLMGKSFLFIKDMGQPDAVFTINGFNINILPISMTLINCISGAIYSKGHALREKIQIYGMALIFLVILYNSPAGLVVYWTMNNVFSLVKNVFYKMKNPLKVLYICMCVVLITGALYIMFGYGGGAGLKKRIPAALFLLIWLPIPLYIKIGNNLITKTFKPIFTNKNIRLRLFLFSAVGLTILNGLLLPSQLISSSVQEFSTIKGNPIEFFHSSFWTSFGFIIFWPTCIYFLFKDKLKTVLSFLFAAMFISAIMNAFAFAGNYGSMDSTLKFIDGFKDPSFKFILINSISCILILIATALFIKFNISKVIVSLFGCVILAFTVLSIHTISSISSEYKEFSMTQASASDSQPIKFHLSKTEKNVIIFMLDRFESAYVPYILEEQPELKAELTGFTYYKNCASYNGHTLMGSPGVYGGYEYTPYEMNKRDSQLLKDKHNEAISLLPKILSEQADFNCVMSDTSWANYSYIADMSFADENTKLNLNDEKVKRISLLSKYSGDFKKEKLDTAYEKFTLEHVLNRNLFWTSLFRVFPAAVRPVIYYKGTWWENGVKESSSSFADWYSCLYYMPKFTAIDSDNPTLTMITNECTHSGEDISMYDIQSTDNYLMNDNSYKINSVTLAQMGRIIKFLKENNVYDNSRIIIVSDHGIGRNNKLYESPEFEGYCKDRLNPILLVKDFNSKNSLKIDENTFMTNADVPSLALKDIIDSPVNPFTGESLEKDYKSNGIIITRGDIFMPYHSGSKYKFTLRDDEWIIIKNNLFEDSNWSRLVK